MNIVLWVVQILLALAFLMAGGMKISQPMEKLRKAMSWTSHASIGTVRLIGDIGNTGRSRTHFTCCHRHPALVNTSCSYLLSLNHDWCGYCPYPAQGICWFGRSTCPFPTWPVYPSHGRFMVAPLS